MGFVVIIDGPNFINALIKQYDKDYVINRLRLPALHTIIQQRLGISGLSSHPFIHTYFICSKRQRIGEFRASDRDNLLNKLNSQIGVTVTEIEQTETSGEIRKEKEVDMHVFIKMLEMGPLSTFKDPWKHIVLISSDKDFVPAIRILSQLGTHTITVGFNNEKSRYPPELIGESFLFLELGSLLSDAEALNLTEEVFGKICEGLCFTMFIRYNILYNR
jgi:uncharacterized LabA/DUF88 family protein